MSNIEFESIGEIHTPFKKLEGMPIQPIGAQGVKGEIHIKQKYLDGLKDIKHFSHLNLIYHLHKVKNYKLEVKPFLDTKTHGIFATRSPKRPNPIGLSVVQLDKVKNNILYVSNVDILDKTPIIDIKPYVPQLYQDTIENLKIGWFETKKDQAKTTKADSRFID